MRELLRSGIARGFDVRRGDNVAALVLVLGAAIAWAALSTGAGAAWMEVVLGSGSFALSVLLAWAIGRELDPERPATALGAALLLVAITGIMALAATAPGPLLAASFLLLVATRVAAGTTGREPGLLDAVLVAGLVVLAVGTPAGLAAAAMLPVGLLLARMRGRRVRLPLLGLVLASGVVGVVLQRPEVPGAGPLGLAAAVLLLAVLLAWGMLGAAVHDSRPSLRRWLASPAGVPTDAGEPLPRWQVVAGRITCGAGLVAAAAMAPSVLEDLLPAWCAFVVVAGAGLATAVPGAGSVAAGDVDPA